MLILAYKLFVTQSKDISITETEQKPETNEAWYGSSLVSFYNKNGGFLYTVTGYLAVGELILAVGTRFNGRCPCGEVAVVG